MNKQDVSDYFNLLTQTLEEKGLVNKPNDLFKMNEPGLQLNKPPKYVISEKGSNIVLALKSRERVKTILMECGNASRETN